MLIARNGCDGCFSAQHPIDVILANPRTLLAIPHAPPSVASGERQQRKKKRQKLGENEKVDDGKNKSWAEENRRQKKFDASESYVRPVMEHLLLHV